MGTSSSTPQRDRHSPHKEADTVHAEQWKGPPLNTEQSPDRREENKTKQKDLQREDDDPADVSFLKLDPRCHCRCRRPSLLWKIQPTSAICAFSPKQSR